MSNKVLVKRSNVPGRVPSVAQVVAGELAVNTADEKIYFGTGVSVHELAKQTDLSAISQHSGLQGLSNDDHAQYVHLGLPRTITAKHSYEPVTPDAPFALGVNAVNQKVVGLNADQLDGLDSSAFVQTTDLGLSVATLDAQGKLNASQVPAIAVTDTYVVDSEAEMLALASATIGAVAIRTDLSKSFILKTNSPSTLADWQELLSPNAQVDSVNGQIGVVTLNTSNIAENTNLYFTTARARAALSVSGSLAYNSVTGLLSFNDAVPSVNGRTGAITLAAADVGLGSVENKNSATIRSEITSANIITGLGFTPQEELGYIPQQELGFTPQDVALKDVANGYVGLDVNGLINANVLNQSILHTALQYVPEDSANKNQPNGYLGLDADGKVNASYLPAVAQTAVTGAYAGNVAQMSATSTMNVSTTAPTTAMGTQVMTQVVTPANLTSKMVVEFSGVIDSSSNGATVNVAVFRNAVFIGMSSVYLKTAGQIQPMALRIVDEPNTTSPVTYSIRIGTTAGTWYLGRGTTNTFGGVNPSGWTITQLY